MTDHDAWTRAQANLKKMMDGDEVSPEEAREAVRMASRGDADTLRAVLHAARDAYHRSTGEDPKTSLLTKKKHAVYLLAQAGEFWNGYEGVPHGRHYATVRYSFTGNDSVYKDVYGVEHVPIVDLKDSLHAHAKVSQEKLKLLRGRADLQFRDNDTGPEILLYRGVYGDYGNHVKAHPHSVSVAPVQSWTTDADQAHHFSSKGDDESSGAVIAAWIPVHQVVHVGGGAHIGYHPEHEDESEVVVHHPSESLKPVHVYHYGQVGEHGTNPKKFKKLKSVPVPAIPDATLNDAINEHGPDSELTGKTYDPGLFKSEDGYDYRPVMYAIGHLESSGGKNREHAPQLSGIHAGTRAISSYGLMPATVYETVLKSPRFKNSPVGQAVTSPGRYDPSHINSVTKDKAMDEAAFRHVWAYKRDRVSKFVPEHEDRDAVTAFAHREGVTGAKRAYLSGGIHAILSHPYVRAFQKLRGKEVADQPLEKTMKQDVFKFDPNDLRPSRLPKDLLGELVHSKQVGPGLWNHHWLRRAHMEFGYHVLSRSPDPLKPAVAFLALARGPGDRHFSVMGSGVRQEERGKGLGKTLYLAALDHHGSLQSDTHTTDAAEGLWNSLVKELGGTRARRGSLERHVVEKKQ